MAGAAGVVRCGERAILAARDARGRWFPVEFFGPEGAVGEIVKGIVPHLGGRPRKGRQPAFTQKAVAVLCGKDVNTVARWESGAIKPPLGYRVELRVKGGVEFFDWVREYNAHNGVADIFVHIQKGNVAYTEGLTEREKGLVEEYIQELRRG